VIGGKLTRELAKTKLRDVLAEWARVGLLCKADDQRVEIEETKILEIKIKSNDAHILALALVTGCRLLFSYDRELIDDFKKVALVSPKGKVIMPTTRADKAKALFDRYGA